MKNRKEITNHAYVERNPFHILQSFHSTRLVFMYSVIHENKHKMKIDIKEEWMTYVMVVNSNLIHYHFSLQKILIANQYQMRRTEKMERIYRKEDEEKFLACLRRKTRKKLFLLIKFFHLSAFSSTLEVN